LELSLFVFPWWLSGNVVLFSVLVRRSPLSFRRAGRRRVLSGDVLAP